MRAESGQPVKRNQAAASLVEHWLQEEVAQEKLPQTCNGLWNSDAAAVMGMDPQKSSLDLWREKVGLLMSTSPNVAETSASTWDLIVEPLVATVYSKRTGNPVKRVNKVLQHPDHPWMLANVRWEVLDTPEVQHLVCLRIEVQDWSGWSDGVPLPMRMDVMHSLAVTGQRAVDIAVLVAGRNLRVLRVERDEKLIERLFGAEVQLWISVKQQLPSMMMMGSEQT